MQITPLRMPKWGLTMQEGSVVGWSKAVGDEVRQGEDLVDIETAKITNVFESPGAGVLRRILAPSGETLPVGALIGVLAEASTSEAELDAFVAEFGAPAVPEEDAERQTLTFSLVAAGGHTIRVGRAGSGDRPPVVLIHGFAGDLNGWLFNLDGLIARGSVIAIDLPGHGGSSKDVGDGSLATLAEAVVATLAALQVEAAHLVGHSLGAAIAARVAIDHPGLVRSLVLISPAGLGAHGVSTPFLDGVVSAQRPKDLKVILQMLPADPALVSREMVDDLLKAKRLDGAEEALALLRDRLVDGADAAALRRDLEAIPSALVIASDADRIVGVIQPEDLPAGFRLARVEGAGHLPHLEKAAQVNALLEQALD